MGSCDCYFAWAEMRKNTSSLGVFFFFSPACSCQLRYTKILGAAGRHLAKKLRFAFTVRYIWAHHAAESTGSNVSAHLRWHSHLLHTVSASAAPEKDNPCCFTPWRNPGFPPWSAQLTVATQSLGVGARSALWGSRRKRVKSLAAFIPLHIHN